MSSDIAISVRGLGKSYVIDHGGRGGESLKEAIAGAFRRRFTRARADEPQRENFWALRDVSFDVHRGEIIGIVGANGSGKSTLLKILSRIMDPTEGEVVLRGRVSSLLEVGTGFRADLSGRDNVYLNGAILGLSHAEVRRRFDDIVAFAGVEKFIDTPVKHYSSGMHMRLAFSVATAFVSDILMLDEVLAVGDSEFQKKCLHRVNQIKRSGKTILFVSHDAASVARLCSKAVYLESGRMKAFGPAIPILKAYEESVATSYIATTATESQGGDHSAGGQGSGPATEEGARASDPPLAERSDRRGDGAFRFVAAEVALASGGPAGTTRTAADTVVRVAIDNPGKEPVYNVEIAIGFDNETEERITILVTDVRAATIERLPPGRSELTFRMPRLPFVAGFYSFTLYGTADSEVADWVQRAGTFEVVSGDYFGTGRMPPAGQGSIVVDFDVDVALGISPTVTPQSGRAHRSDHARSARGEPTEAQASVSG